MNSYVVTGSRGFIGRRLMSRLSNLEESILTLSHENIYDGRKAAGDRCFFLSTYGNMASHTDHAMMVKANVGDLLMIVNFYNGWFCYMSSSSVTLPIQTPYSRTKRAAEEILQALPELKSCIVRPYSVTGVGEQKEHLIPKLIRSCMEGEPMTFDPEPVHDFIDVEDVVDGLVALADEQATGIHEFGNGCAHRNESVRQCVQDITGRKANITEVKRLRSYDNTDWYCRNPSSFCQPKKSLETSIQEMADEYVREKNH